MLYRVRTNDGEMHEVDNPSHWPEPALIHSVEEPFIKASILVPEKHMGAAIELCRVNRAASIATNYLAQGRLEIVVEMPLAEVLFDFYDRLKSVTRGYGSLDYEELDYRLGEIVKVDILVHHERVDALAFLAHSDKARARSLHYCEQLAGSIPAINSRSQCKVRSVAASFPGLPSMHFARTSPPMLWRRRQPKRKTVGKTKKGKERMKVVGSVEIPQDAFVSVLRTDRL